ncbi:efflux RND transporter periplasmic adaptor subunit [Bradyrhizobium sp. PUT101]|uniref:efflux RND transporter periplasmic adaptor subunit n=1 Tax=Bradyrhizobium sp. PUT101 TaxID=3447427 RepID=UPI003F86574C
MTKPARSFFVLSLLILLAACNEKAVNDQTSGKPIGAPVTTVEVVDIPVSYTVPGSVISDGRIVVSSRVVGFIEQLDVREGQKVSRGDLLVRIDPSDIDEAIRQAQAGVRASQEDLEDAERDAQRYATLAPSGAVASETLRKSRVRADIARAALDKARSALAAAEAQRSYATITSPVDGVIVSVARRRGEMATAGSTILIVESREVLLFKAFVSERNLALINPNTPVVVRIDTLSDTPFAGHIRGIVPSGDEITRRYEINIVLPNDPSLVPGMFGRTEIVLGMQKTPTIPRGALVRRGGIDGVFVLDGKIARFRWLRTGRDLGDSVEVVAGLAGGETILAVVNDTVRDGSVVEKVERAR